MILKGYKRPCPMCRNRVVSFILVCGEDAKHDAGDPSGWDWMDVSLVVAIFEGACFMSDLMKASRRHEVFDYGV